MRNNVLGQPLAACCEQKVGFYRDGYCRVGPEDGGRHAVCSEVTAEFLAFTKSEGNDLSTPNPLGGFAGLKPGDRWCLCVTRWLAAAKAGHAPKVDLAATDEDALGTIDLALLKKHALPPRG